MSEISDRQYYQRQVSPRILTTLITLNGADHVIPTPQENARRALLIAEAVHTAGDLYDAIMNPAPPAP